MVTNSEVTCATNLYMYPTDYVSANNTRVRGRSVSVKVVGRRSTVKVMMREERMKEKKGDTGKCENGGR